MRYPLDEQVQNAEKWDTVCEKVRAKTAIIVFDMGSRELIPANSSSLNSLQNDHILISEFPSTSIKNTVWCQVKNLRDLLNADFFELIQFSKILKAFHAATLFIVVDKSTQTELDSLLNDIALLMPGIDKYIDTITFGFCNFRDHADIQESFQDTTNDGQSEILFEEFRRQICEEEYLVLDPSDSKIYKKFSNKPSVCDLNMAFDLSKLSERFSESFQAFNLKIEEIFEESKKVFFSRSKTEGQHILLIEKVDKFVKYVDLEVINNKFEFLLIELENELLESEKITIEKLKYLTGKFPQLKEKQTDSLMEMHETQQETVSEIVGAENPSLRPDDAAAESEIQELKAEMSRHIEKESWRLFTQLGKIYEKICLYMRQFYSPEQARHRQICEHKIAQYLELLVYQFFSYADDENQENHMLIEKIKDLYNASWIDGFDPTLRQDAITRMENKLLEVLSKLQEKLLIMLDSDLDLELVQYLQYLVIFLDKKEPCVSVFPKFKSESTAIYEIIKINIQKYFRWEVSIILGENNSDSVKNAEKAFIFFNSNLSGFGSLKHFLYVERKKFFNLIDQVFNGFLETLKQSQSQLAGHVFENRHYFDDESIFNQQQTAYHLLHDVSIYCPTLASLPVFKSIVANNALWDKTILEDIKLLIISALSCYDFVRVERALTFLKKLRALRSTSDSHILTLYSETMSQYLDKFKKFSNELNGFISKDDCDNVKTGLKRLTQLQLVKTDFYIQKMKNMLEQHLRNVSNQLSINIMLFDRHVNKENLKDLLKIKEQFDILGNYKNFEFLEENTLTELDEILRKATLFFQEFLKVISEFIESAIHSLHFYNAEMGVNYISKVAIILPKEIVDEAISLNELVLSLSRSIELNSEHIDSLISNPFLIQDFFSNIEHATKLDPKYNQMLNRIVANVRSHLKARLKQIEDNCRNESELNDFGTSLKCYPQNLQMEFELEVDLLRQRKIDHFSDHIVWHIYKGVTPGLIANRNTYLVFSVFLTLLFSGLIYTFKTRSDLNSTILTLMTASGIGFLLGYFLSKQEITTQIQPNFTFFGKTTRPSNADALADSVIATSANDRLPQRQSSNRFVTSS